MILIRILKNEEKMMRKREMPKKAGKREDLERQEPDLSEETADAAEEFERRRSLILDVMNEKAYVPMKLKELAILLNIPKEQRKELSRVVNSLLEEGKISISAKGKLGRPETFALVGLSLIHI